MRITYFMDTFRIGGAERFLADLAAGVARAGHEVTVVSPNALVLDLVRTTAPEPKLVRMRADMWVESSRAARIGAFAQSFSQLPFVLRATHADVLHVNNGGYPGSELCRAATVAARVAGKPKCVLSIHNPAWPRDSSRRRLQTTTDRVIWRSVDVVHASSGFVEETLIDRRGVAPAMCRHIPYGVGAPAGSPEEVAALRARLNPNDDAVLVGLVAATGEPHKGHALLVEALAQTAPNLRAVIVGPHPGDSLVAQISRLGLDSRVALEGQVSSEQVALYQRALDLLVVPSTAYESLPLVILEAMAAGKPVFASRLAGIPEAVVDGESGRLFTPGAVDELAALLREVSRAPDVLRQMGRVGHERWRETFSLPAMTASMLALYEELAPGFAR